MQRRKFGKTGVLVPIVGQGSWPLPNVTALRYGIELGMTHIDTAEMYGNGRSEELVGEAIRGYRRDKLFLVSKVLPEHGGRGDIERACERSLQRMKIDMLDCYLLHWRGDVDFAETMQGLERLVQSGKTRFIGVSNLDPWDLREAKAALGSTFIACNQVYYNLEQRTVEEHELPTAHAEQQALVAYTPLGGLVGPGVATLADIGREIDIDASTVALAFLLRDESVFVIPKASNLMHVEANARAGEISLSPSQIARIDAAFPRSKRTGSLPTN